MGLPLFDIEDGAEQSDVVRGQHNSATSDRVRPGEPVERPLKGSL